MRPRRLKLCTRVDSGQMYCVYQNQAAAAHSSQYFFFIFLSLQFSDIKIFCHTFLTRPRRLKLGTYVDSGQMYFVYRNEAAAAYNWSLYFSFFFLSNFQTLKFFVSIFSGSVRPRTSKLGTHMDGGQIYRVRPRRLKLSTHVDNGWMYCVYWNQAAAAYSSLYFFIFLSLQFSSIKIFHYTFLRNCEA